VESLLFGAMTLRKLSKKSKKKLMTLNVLFYLFRLILAWQFKKISKPCTDLIKKLLAPEDDRITIEEALDHPWFKNKIARKNTINLKLMEHFLQYSQLKVFLLSYIINQQE
jgi:hypothetical protein